MFELQEDGGVVEISLHVHQHPARMLLICLTLAKFQRDQSKVWCCLVVVIKVRKSIASLPDVWADVVGTVNLNKHDKLSTIPWSSNNWNRDLIFCRTIVQCFVGKNITQWLFQSKIMWILKKSIFLLLLATYFAEKGFKAWRHHFPETTCFILSQIYTLDL